MSKEQQDKLIKAIKDNDYDTVHNLIADEKLDPNFSFDNWSPISHAAQFQHKTILYLLVENGADVNFTSENTNWTALHSTADKGNVELTKYLLYSGADATIKNKTNKTPLDIANNGEIKIRLKCNMKWEKLSENEILHSELKEPYSITRDFNFEAMTQMTIVENLDNKSLGLEEKHFSDPAVNIDLLLKAKAELLSQDGVVDELKFRQSLNQSTRISTRHFDKRHKV